MSRTWKILILTCLLCSAEAHAAGFPQLDHRWYPNQLFWLVISFGLLYIVVSKFVVPNIHGVLATRNAAIDDAIREAERAKRTAESTKSNLESANMEARNTAATLLAKAQAETSAETNAALAKLDHDLARKITQADVRIEEMKARAMESMNAATASLANSMAAKLLGRAIVEADTAPIITRLTKAS